MSGYHSAIFLIINKAKQRGAEDVARFLASGYLYSPEWKLSRLPSASVSTMTRCQDDTTGSCHLFTYISNTYYVWMYVCILKQKVHQSTNLAIHDHPSKRGSASYISGDENTAVEHKQIEESW
jgi:hypothetical protein